MLVFAGITPHSPLLLPSINPNQLQKVEETRHAMEELAEELYASFPDTIILISEHPTQYKEAFSINISDPFVFDLSTFGDLGMRHTFRPDIALADSLQRSLRKQEQLVTLTTDDALHYASAVPLELLTQNLQGVKLLPITYSDASPKAHFQFGQALKDVVMNTNTRVAIIASGDLSHAHSTDAPAGFRKEADLFDKKIVEIVSQKNASGLLNFNQELVKESEQTIYRQLLMLFGLIDRVSVQPHVHSYEKPFGVGYLVVDFTLR